MPVGAFKNTLYGLALPLLGRRCTWRAPRGDALARALWRRRAVSACVQRFEKGRLTGCVCVGGASPETVFRTASVAKMVTALLVFRLQTLGRLSVGEDVSDFLGLRVRNPHSPDAPVTLGMLLSHTSGIVDSPAYFAAFQRHTPERPALGPAQLPPLRARNGFPLQQPGGGHGGQPAGKAIWGEL